MKSNHSLAQHARSVLLSGQSIEAEAPAERKAAPISEVNVNGAQTEVTDVTTDVAKVEAKLDRLGPALDDIEATTVRTIQNADRLETTSLRHDATADRIESKVDQLKIQQGDTSDLLADLEKAQLRMLIEADLVRQSNTRIALFQLPASIGGHLELVQSIVEETLQRRAAAGIDVRSSLTLVKDAVRDYGFRNYKSVPAHILRFVLQRRPERGEDGFLFRHARQRPQRFASVRAGFRPPCWNRSAWRSREHRRSVRAG